MGVGQPITVVRRPLLYALLRYTTVVQLLKIMKQAWSGSVLLRALIQLIIDSACLVEIYSDAFVTKRKNNSSLSGIMLASNIHLPLKETCFSKETSFSKDQPSSPEESFSPEGFTSQEEPSHAPDTFLEC